MEPTTFDNFAIAVTELLDHLGVHDRFVYLHDFGAPVGFRIAMDHPELVRGLIVQSANAHQTGLGPQWKKTMEYWSHPDAENEAAAHAWVFMTNHVHLVGIPASEDSLERALRPLHTRHAQGINRARGWSGHLWQGRFFSSALDERYL